MTHTPTTRTDNLADGTMVRFSVITIGYDDMTDAPFEIRTPAVGVIAGRVNDGCMGAMPGYKIITRLGTVHYVSRRNNSSLVVI